MLYVQSDNRIELTQGNSATINITPYDAETKEPVILGEGDKVLFTVKTKLGTPKMQKTLTNLDYEDPEDTSLNCDILPEDTIDWDLGDYLYDCLLLTSDSEAITFISSTLCISKAIGKYTDVEVRANE